MSPLWAVAMPLLGGCGVLLVPRRWARELSAVAGVVTWVVGLVVAIPQLGAAQGEAVTYATLATGAVPIALTLSVDGLAALMVLLATSVALAVLVYSAAYLRDDPRYPTYAFLVLVFTTAMNTVVLADDFFVLLVGWEVMGACSYFLIGHFWERQDARAGAVKAFVMTRLGDIGLLFGIFVFGVAVGSFRISAVNDAADAGDLSTTTATVAMLLVLCGVVGKSAQFPLHTWLPDAMPGPTPISALIHAATMVAAGVYLIARLLPVLDLSSVASSVLAVIAAISMLLAALFALAQDDLKRVFAWSTVSQLAYMFGALAVGGYAAGIFHLMSHGAFKALLFLCAGAVAHAVGSTSMSEMGGLWSRLPVTAATMGIGLLALVGLPPVVGFFSKDAVLGVVVDAALLGGSVTVWLLLVSSAGRVLLFSEYALRAWLMVCFGTPSTAVAEAETTAHEPPWLMRGPLVVLAAVTLFGGLVLLSPRVLVDPSDPDTEFLHPEVAVTATLAVLLVIGLVYAGWRRSGRRDPALLMPPPVREFCAREAGFDEGYDRAFTRPTNRLADGVVANDRDVVEPYVRGSAFAARGLGAVLRLAQNGNVQVYLSAAVVGAVLVVIAVATVTRAVGA
ncbi:MAG: NADH-quinone oxidoreductase subunit 5 family protein [Nocardioidaceae bacterium]